MIKHVAYYLIHTTAHPIGNVIKNINGYEGFDYIGLEDQSYVYRLDVTATNGRIADFEASLDANAIVKHYEYNEVRCVESQYDANQLIWAHYDHSQNHWYVCTTDADGYNESEDNGPFESVEDAIKDMDYTIASNIKESAMTYRIKTSSDEGCPLSIPASVDHGLVHFDGYKDGFYIWSVMVQKGFDSLEAYLDQNTDVISYDIAGGFADYDYAMATSRN